MADLALVSTTAVSIVEPMIIFPGVAGANIVAGQLVRFDVATGRFVLAVADIPANARVFGMAMRSVSAGQALTVVRKGIVDGFVLDASAWDAAIYLGNVAGNASDTVGTVSTVIGRVVPGFYNTAGRPHDKLLFVDL
jgi:hypothetical protein